MDGISFKEFSKNYNNKKNQILYEEFISDLETPISSLLKLSPNEKYSFLLESVEGGDQRGRYSFLGINPDLIWEYKNKKIKITGKNSKLIKTLKIDDKPLKSLRILIKNSQTIKNLNLPPCPVLVGYMGYPMITLMENINLKNQDTINIPDSKFIRPKLIAAFDNIKDKITLMTPVYYSEKISAKKAYNDSKYEISKIIEKLRKEVLIKNIKRVKKNKKLIIKCNYTKKEYLKIIQKTKKFIKKGDIFQAVISQRFKINYELGAISLYRSLRRLNPSPFLVNLNFNNFGLVASSPEILVRLRNNKITIRPIAGTRPRGKNKKEDKILSKELLSDKKELAEHLMLLDLGRNDVGKISKINTVKVTEKMIVEYYSHVMHIVSNVEGIIDKKFDAIDALVSGFPAGTVSGAPKIRAMEIIEKLEKHNRSFYGGAIGYFDSNGNMDTCIALRTALIKNKKLYVQSGGGIVFDSDPNMEYTETINKSKAIIKAAEDSYKVQ